jgi:hypothetical protein
LPAYIQERTQTLSSIEPTSGNIPAEVNPRGGRHRANDLSILELLERPLSFAAAGFVGQLLVAALNCYLRHKQR